MGYSEAMFDTVASILVSPEQPKRTDNLRGFDDFVIALSMDSGLSTENVRMRLEKRMNLARAENEAPFKAQQR